MMLDADSEKMFLSKYVHNAYTCTYAYTYTYLYYPHTWTRTFPIFSGSRVPKMAEDPVFPGSRVLKMG